MRQATKRKNNTKNSTKIGKVLHYISFLATATAAAIACHCYCHATATTLLAFTGAAVDTTKSFVCLGVRNILKIYILYARSERNFTIYNFLPSWFWGCLIFVGFL